MSKNRKLSPEAKHHLTIIAGVSGIDSSEAISDDVRLIRSGLLYADKITVKSIGTTMLHQMLSISSYGNEHMLKVLFGVMFNAGAFSDQQAQDMERLFQASDEIRKIRATTNRKAWRTEPQYEQLRVFQSQYVNKMWDSMIPVRDHFQAMWDKAGGQEIDAAVEAGILTFDTDWADETVGIINGDDLDSKAKFFIDTLRRSDSAVLLDPMMEGIYQALNKEGYLKLPKFRSDNIRKTKLGTRMTVQLPNLSDAPTDLILSVRNEIEPRLHEYHLAVKKLDSTLSEDIFSPDLDDEMDQLWNDEVLPQVHELEIAVFDSRLGRFKDAVIATTKAAAGTALTSGLVFAVANPAQVFHEPLATAGFAAAAALGTPKSLVESGLNGLKESLQKTKHLKSNELFYLADINHAAKKLS